MMDILFPESKTDFMYSSKHIQFEQADLNNDVQWFEEHYKKYGKDMDSWTKTTCIFPWTNYLKWKETLKN